MRSEGSKDVEIKRFPIIKLDFSSEISRTSFPKNLTHQEKDVYNERPKYFLVVFCSLEYSKRRNGEIIKSLAILRACFRIRCHKIVSRLACYNYNERPKYFLAVFCSLEYSKRQNGELLKSLAI